jgi:hypothetical protein
MFPGRLHATSSPAHLAASPAQDGTMFSRTYLFSAQKGYLELPATELRRHNVTRRDLWVPSDARCFGPAAGAFLLRHLVGYDTVARNWFIRGFGGRGFLFNTYSRVSASV